MASLGCLLRRSPFYDTQLLPLLEASHAKEILKAKLRPGECGEKGIEKKDVKRLVDEVADMLCP